MISADIGDGTPLVLIHGFGVDHRIMLALEEAVNFSGYRRIYVDLPRTAQGRNPAAQSAHEVLNIVETEIDQYLKGEAFALIGNSFGALLARYIAHSNPRVLGLATLAGVFQPDKKLRNVPPKTVLHSDSSVPATAAEDVEDFSEIAVIQTERNFQAFQKYVLPGLRTADEKILEAISQRYSIEPTPEAIAAGDYEAPALHIFGRQDHVVGYNDGLHWMEHYKRGTFVVLNEAGHNVHVEQPTLTGALIEDWLKRIDEYRQGELQR